MSRRVKVDMTNVESFSRCPEGEWLAKLKKIEEVTIQGSGDDGLKAQFEVIKGDAKGNSVFETFSMSEKALWKLKSFLEAAGVKSTGRITLDLDKLEGKICIIDVIHEEYNGQKRAKISAYIKPGDSDDEDDEDELDDEADEDEDDEPKKPAKKTGSKKAPTKTGKKHSKPEDDDDDEDLDDDEDDEEPEPPKKSKKTPAKKPAAKKSAPKKSKPEPEEDEDDDDDEDDWEEDDD